MSSVITAHRLNISGGTFIQAHGDVHYHDFRESLEILRRATATAAFHNSKERFDPPKCHPKTRVAVLEELMRLIKWGDDLESFIIWVYGPAGAGKSAIAQTIAEMCEEEMILLASFFFSRNDPSRSTVDPLVATIAYQITLSLPEAREIILRAIERDPLIFTKSLAVQVKSLIMTPLRSLVESGAFNNTTSRHLIIIDGLDECFDPKAQQNIVEVLANSQRQHGHQLPLFFLIASRPEQHISYVFNTGFLPGITTRLALDESYLPDKDIEIFLIDKFQEIKSSHPRRAYIPTQWPLPDVLRQLVTKSSGQFIYAATVIRYVTSMRHKPTDRLDIVLGIRPPQRDLPFSELDALYTHILNGVEEIERVLEILSFILFGVRYNWGTTTIVTIEKFLSLQPGDAELYLEDLPSLINYTSQGEVHILHASLTDFLVDPTRSKTLWINPPAQHAVFACRCLQILQLKEVNIGLFWIGYCDAVYHLENAEMTPGLRDDLINFSFDRFWDTRNKNKELESETHSFSVPFLECVKKLPFPEAGHISKTFQAAFDRMLCNVLEKYYSYPGFTLLLGSILRYVNVKPRYSNFDYPPGLVASLYMFRQQGGGPILDDTGFSEFRPYDGPGYADAIKFFTYFMKLLENPKQSGTLAFDQHRYATATKECLQLCLCNHHEFSKGAIESACRDSVLLRNKPWAWKARLGVHGRVRSAWKTMHKSTFRQSMDDAGMPMIDQKGSFIYSSSGHDFYRFLAYRWGLDLLPFLLEKSEISLELANILRTHTFTLMAWQTFPRRLRIVEEAISTYLLRAEEQGIPTLTHSPNRDSDTLGE